ncbi:MAG TPA: hypothetical protein VFC25_16655 [Verrucomicrobiae bacterium]|nr:hypothetical protein [Verrucomicrobiae bacterium]
MLSHHGVRVILRALAGAALFLLIVAWPAPAQAAACPCSLPADQTCPSACSSCATQIVSCQCDTGCTSGSCPSGYSQVSSSTCFPNIFQSNYTCSTSRIRHLSTCTGCAAGRYGPNCDACPGGAANPCSGHGTCNEGIAGSGACICAVGYTGPACQYSDATTCNGHGTVSSNGSCVCNVGFTGPTCDACATDYYAYPACQFCNAGITCTGHGTCTASGACACANGFAGPNCGACAIDFYGYPACRFCQAGTTCNGHGACGATGFCACDDGFAGAGCDSCGIDHYAYPQCVYCNSQTTCTGHGTCDASGFCVCDAGFSGRNCVDCGATSVELSCSDTIDEDCDGKTDCTDTDCCTAGACAGLDTDGDTFVSCDCDNANGQAWATPGEVHDITLKHAAGAAAKLTWFPPDVPGGSALTYEALRFNDPRDFDLATTCLAMTNPSLNTVTDADAPTEGRAFFYLVRARDACPAGTGPLGTDSSGNPRTATCGH